jgi:hypothetical protein
MVAHHYTVSNEYRYTCLPSVFFCIADSRNEFWDGGFNPRKPEGFTPFQTPGIWGLLQTVLIA